ncbi:16S rRNA (adenine(1518)-N(6)/adenine(1519)-N(6))-dimethyltransferase RsmA [Flavilitoribacter nigricans]|uniref:Ribosomal RNA small subunit methyltransferase A n=1 Tax=Flavilitoribacter nigricans (strain ATCC 23147 / DSM 23189 / NBRC 102662 / NCIMB 1420 / SS-2) TaxID=1122177 RepID=A0A2D0MXR6_FLAN2|nr:16S rRNA (adenine(1518)-N(6)/adenine(1519)-N(6))-dimethyltransferase RsmA [Flavilitoribacter nigricans]PHN01071.1 16S rRNA (adenine(1518)-N(6)/adenine(1519)-N(6))-dimethyltransferase [Flavilitoribacter nigricans DSM 23189 = NBRC 102662]
MKAKKSYGQHFLNNEHLAERIAQLLRPELAYQRVLEVGPGKGMLTKYLLDQDFRLTVVEADRDMVNYLQRHYPALKEDIISADFLKVPLDRLFTEPFALIGNFPYNISSQILFKMLEYRHLIPEMVGMFQLEVAERIIAPPGNKVYGVISVLVQAYYEGEMCIEVDRRNFTPPPKVQSGVIRLTRKAETEIGCDEKLFRRVVKQAFSQRRKMLRNTMKSILTDQELLADSFFNQRPEKLSVADFVQITKWIEERR